MVFNYRKSLLFEVKLLKTGHETIFMFTVPSHPMGQTASPWDKPHPPWVNFIPMGQPQLMVQTCTGLCMCSSLLPCVVSCTSLCSWDDALLR